MKYVYSLLLLVFLSCAIVGLYGILHDQLTYTISPEYYTKFKFVQFGLAYDGMPSELYRFYAGVVGLLATWWMGIPVGIILGLFGWHRDRPTMLKLGLQGSLVVMLVSFAFGMYGLYNGYYHLSNLPREDFHRRFIPDDLIDFKSFIAVGSMHNESHLGGFYGLFAGIAYIGIRKGLMLKSAKKTQVDRKLL